MPEWLHQAIMWLHIASGLVAVSVGTLAVAARKGGPLHARAGTWFFAAMLTLGISAAILEPFRTPEPGSPLVSVIVCYFVLTSWVEARRRDGRTGKFEAFAAAVAIGTATLMLADALKGSSNSPVGSGPVFVFAGLFMLAGAGDLRAFLKKRLEPAQRIARHLWRMCFAFFIATGSFFIGQQDIMPAAVRGNPILFVLGLAPIAIMAFWLARLRFKKQLGRVMETLGQRRKTAAARA